VMKEKFTQAIFAELVAVHGAVARRDPRKASPSAVKTIYYLFRRSIAGLVCCVDE
jgi:hypothetical protein